MAVGERPKLEVILEQDQVLVGIVQLNRLCGYVYIEVLRWHQRVESHPLQKYGSLAQSPGAGKHFGGGRDSCLCSQQTAYKRSLRMLG